MPNYKLFLAAGLLSTFSMSSSAESWDVSGYVSAEVRVFPNDASHITQEDTSVSPSAAIQPEFVYENEQQSGRFTFVPFARWDADDSNRRHVDIREANWLHLEDNWDAVIGIGKVFWGVTESRHLVDIVNQTDFVEDLDGEEKLGQPMVNINFFQDWGTLNVFVLPGFRERTFPSASARLSGGLAVLSDASYESSAKDQRVDLAVRWQQTFANWDVSMSHFSGTSREPMLIPTLQTGKLALLAHYDLIDQTGLTTQYTGDNTLWKLEAISRSGQGHRFTAAVAGIEYTFYGIFDQDFDVGAIVEYLYDDRSVTDAPITFANNDIFVGARMTFNDVQDTALLAGAIVDADTQVSLLSIEAERRLGDAWKLELESRLFLNSDANDPLYRVTNDDFFTIRLSRYY